MDKKKEPMALDPHADNFPCPACGGNMAFDPMSQMLKCDYCDNMVTLGQEGVAIETYDFGQSEKEDSHDWGLATVTIHCNQCGSSAVMEASQTSTFCAYCGSNQVVTGEEDAGLRPESVIPFSITREQAQDQYLKWIRRQWLAPNALQKKHMTDRLQGVYVPHWAFDADVDGYYHCEYSRTALGSSSTKVDTLGDLTGSAWRHDGRMEWRSKSGHIDRHFDNVLVNASVKINDRHMEALKPYYFDKLVPYQPGYLSGFLAEKYGIDKENGLRDAQEVMKNKISMDVGYEVHANHVKNMRVAAQYRDVKYKHLLVPVWISAYEYKGKVYQYLVNGQTGEVQGDMPQSVYKLYGYPGVTMALIVVLYWLYQYSGLLG